VTKTPLVELRAVSRRFDETLAVDDLTLDVRAGEVFGLLGPNGSGKTTTVRMIAGLLTPSAGTVLVQGADVTQAPLAARRSLGFVPDGAPMYPNLSPRQHLELVGRLHGLDEAQLQAEALRLMTVLDLEARIDEPVGRFSRGMRQKTALACALLPRPNLLVLDEPLSGLDAPTAAMFKEVLRAWAEAGRSVIYTSHLLDVVERVCDRMAILDKGKLVGLGSLEDLRARAGEAGTLEQVFRALTHSEDPALQARRLLGE
jgi:ABC-2 type transport system ATP-binding protein